MGKINGCLKCIFIFFNALFMAMGGFLIYLAKNATAISFQVPSSDMPSLVWLWVFAIGILGVSALGIYAARSEKVLALKTFAGFMGIGMIIMMIIGIIEAVQRNQMKTAFSDPSSDQVQTLTTEPHMKEMLNKIQSDLKCCGIVSAEDWGNEIPYSCGCSSSTGHGGYDTSACTSKPQGTSGPSQIYAQSCGELIFSEADFFMKIGLGFCFGFAVTALLGLIITLFMIHQVKANDTGVSIAMRSY
ncbi:leukocyte antigen CD37-like [Archocentrus centrarchus]|uniref:leukocyte antigen CD37-like n=1 Tax=Archocentrus centrarchus TaxID=63155 RepID=UPI0011EA4A02|nr:leukocyte antigen CD37-like [Archocentrus centrarchus]